MKALTYFFNFQSCPFKAISKYYLCPKPERNTNDPLDLRVQNSICNEANNLLLIEESLSYFKKTKKM